MIHPLFSSEMDTHSANLVQMDSVPFPVISDASNQRHSSSSVQSPNMSMTQNNASTIMTFEKCSGLTIGSTSNYFLGSSNQPWNVAKPQTTTALVEDSEVYRKTPTIKEMLESRILISPAFQELVAQSFGSRWAEVFVMLGVSRILVEKLYEDNFNKGGTKEVSDESRKS